MSIIASERPGVFTQYDMSGVVSYSSVGKAVGVAAQSNKAVEGISLITREAQALELFGEDDNGILMGMIRVLLQNGTTKIYVACSGNEEESQSATTDSYKSCFNQLAEVAEVGVLTTDSVLPDVSKALASVVDAAAKNRHEMIGVAADSASTAVTTAAAMNSERMVLHAQGDGRVSAAIAAKIAELSDPAQPLTGEVLLGIEQQTQPLTEDQIDTYILGGVTPLESILGQMQIIRCVSTKTKTGAASDSSFRDINIILTVDTVLKAIREALTLRMKGAKNNQRTLDAIATQTQIELQAKQDAEIINSYETPYVSIDASNPTLCLVEVTFTVTSGLNQIRITAHVSV